MNTTTGSEISIQIFTQKDQNLAECCIQIPGLKSRSTASTIKEYSTGGITRLAGAVRRLRPGGLLEDDLLIEDTDFFDKIRFLNSQHGDPYVFLPHRCETIPNLGDVILSGDPDGGRKDLFWDTGEALKITWPLGDKTFYRATNPHSGCYFLTRSQAQQALNYWVQQNWTPDLCVRPTRTGGEWPAAADLQIDETDSKRLPLFDDQTSRRAVETPPV